MATTSSRWVTCAAVAAVALVCGWLANACGEVDTVLFIRVIGTTANTIHQFDVDVEIDDEMRTFRIPEAKTPINLPTSFTLQVGPSFKGAAKVQVKALDEGGRVVAEGLSTTSSLESGKVNKIEVQISPVVSIPGDGGTRKDAAVDAPASDDARDGATDARDGASSDAVVPDAKQDGPVAPDAAPDGATTDAGVDAAI